MQFCRSIIQNNQAKIEALRGILEKFNHDDEDVKKKIKNFRTAHHRENNRSPTPQKTCLVLILQSTVINRFCSCIMRRLLLLWRGSLWNFLKIGPFLQTASREALYCFQMIVVVNANFDFFFQLERTF